MTTQFDRNSVILLRGDLEAVESGLFMARFQSESGGGEPGVQCGVRVESLCSLYDQLMQADEANELDWTDDLPGCEEISDLLDILWSRWLALAEYSDGTIQKCIEHGVPPDRVVRLSQLIVDVRAFLNPSDVLTGGMLAVHDAAAAEYARGEYLEGLVD